MIDDGNNYSIHDKADVLLLEHWSADHWGSLADPEVVREAILMLIALFAKLKFKINK